MKTLPGAPLKHVISYLWGNRTCTIEVEAGHWWLGFALTPDPNSKSKFIVIAPEWFDFVEPRFELLECGHYQPIKTWSRGRKYYCKRRRCNQCAMEVQ